MLQNNAADTLLEVKKLSKHFLVEGEQRMVLENIDLTVQKGEFVSLLGPSGCGKSTLLRLVSDLVPHDSGSIHKIPDLKLSLVFQNFALFPWLSVKENIGFGLRMADKSPSFIEREVRELISQIRLEDAADKHPKELSGGMKQRVGIARALAMHPQLLLLDEPFSALDTFTAKSLREDLLKIWKENNLTILMVSHLVEEAVELADRVIIFAPNPGRVKKVIDIDIPRPRNKRSAEFFALVDQITEEIVRG